MTAALLGFAGPNPSSIDATSDRDAMSEALFALTVVHQHAGHSTTAPAGAPALQGHWHTYGLLWTAEGYTFSLDGAEQWKTDKTLEPLGREQWPDHVAIDFS